MNIDIKDVITLDDKDKYIVVSKTNYENETYFYLIDINNNEEFKLLKLNKENGKLAEFEDEKLVQILLPLFFNETIKAVDINNIISE